jgi:putative CocE/NonD family hydrolase
LIHAFTRRLLRLPRQRHKIRHEVEWIAVGDGTRLATQVLRPLDRSAPRAPAVLLRTPLGTQHPLEPTVLLARALAGLGCVAVLQDARGRFGSEGRFTPFVHEADDGVDTITWIEEQTWYDGRLALVGSSYSAWAALAVAARAPGRVAALALEGGGSRPELALRPGGAFALEFGLALALGLSGREPPGDVDLARALRHRPLREADRVALRETTWFRDWLSHPPDHAAWEALTTTPLDVPAALFLGGLRDPWLESLLADQASCANTGTHTRLVLGPWPHPRPPRLDRSGRAAGRVVFPELLNFLAGELLDDPRVPAGVHVHTSSGVLGFESWPAPGTHTLSLHLLSEGRANGAAGDGRLSRETPASGQSPDRYTYDPEDPVPSRGGRLLSDVRGGQRGTESRADVLCYAGERLSKALAVHGPARVVLFATSSAPDTDFTARLVDLDAAGNADPVAEGIVRCRYREGASPLWLEPDRPVRLEIELSTTSHVFEIGHQLRLEISSSSFPRFDRNPNTRAAPEEATSETSQRAEQTVLHDATHPSCLELPALEH